MPMASKAEADVQQQLLSPSVTKLEGNDQGAEQSFRQIRARDLAHEPRYEDWHILLHSAQSQQSKPHHDTVLQGGVWHLHATRAANGRMGHVPISTNLIGGVHDDNALAQIICQDACHLTDDCGLAHPRTPQEQHAVGDCTNKELVSSR